MTLLVKDIPANAGDKSNVGSVPELGRSPREGNDNSLQYSCLEKPMDRGAWWATAHGVAKNWTRLKQLSLHSQADKKKKKCSENYCISSQGV